MTPRATNAGASMVPLSTTYAAHPECARTPIAFLRCFDLEAVEWRVMVEARDTGSRFGCKFGIDVGDDDAGIRSAFSKDLSPGRHDQRMPVGPASVGVQSALRGRNDK